METFRVPVDGAELFVRAAGPENAPRVLLLHGALAASRAMWGQVAALKRTYRCFAVDQRGHGGSTRLGTGDNGWDRFNADQLIADARILLDELRPNAWVGVSMGGMVSANAAARWPDEVGAMCLLSTAPRPTEARNAYFRNMAPDKFVPGMQRLYDEWHGADYWPDLARHVTAYFAGGHQDAYPGERLKAYAGPALVVHGKDDDLVPVDEADLWHRWLPQADVRVVPGDHAFFAGAGRRETNEVLREFLARHLG